MPPMAGGQQKQVDIGGQNTILGSDCLIPGDQNDHDYRSTTL